MVKKYYNIEGTIRSGFNLSRNYENLDFNFIKLGDEGVVALSTARSIKQLVRLTLSNTRLVARHDTTQVVASVPIVNLYASLLHTHVPVFGHRHRVLVVLDKDVTVAGGDVLLAHVFDISHKGNRFYTQLVQLAEDHLHHLLCHLGQDHEQSDEEECATPCTDVCDPDMTHNSVAVSRCAAVSPPPSIKAR